MDTKRSILYIVIPCYNEQSVLRETEKRLSAKIAQMTENGLISDKSRIVFVDDGSTDDTWGLIKEMYEKHNHVTGIRSSRNRGHQNTLLEGLMTVRDDCDITISMDADLQDDIEVLDDFVKQYYAGCEIVYGVRSDRKTDTWFKRTSAQMFYRLLRLLGVNVVYNHADYRLMSRRALEELSGFGEVNLFLRGMVPLIGLKTGVVRYERNRRFAGESKYPLKKMIAFALDGITSFSIRPIRIITWTGVLLFGISVCLLAYFFAGYLMGKTIRGWASLVISIWGISGLQLLALGVIGEYVGKMYMETKGRPRYIVEEYLKK